MQRSINIPDVSVAPHSATPEAISTQQSNTAGQDVGNSDANVNTPEDVQQTIEPAPRVGRQLNDIGCLAFLSELSGKRGAAVTFAHACLGLALLVLGCVIKASVADTPIVHPSFPGTLPSPDEFLPYTEIPWQRRGVVLAPDIVYSCVSIICSPYLALICVCIGCVFMFCSISSGLMVTKKRPEYACCHLVWLSLSALCSITLASACIMGLKNTVGEGKVDVGILL